MKYSLCGAQILGPMDKQAPVDKAVEGVLGLGDSLGHSSIDSPAPDPDCVMPEDTEGQNVGDCEVLPPYMD
jgi:hypothetical protein